MQFLAKYNVGMFYSFHVYAQDFAEMYYHQEGKCAICREPPPTTGFVIDHDHKTGNIRGLLCHRCNTVLGHFEKGHRLGRKQEFLRQPIEYYQQNYYGAKWRTIIEFKNGVEVDRRLNERVLSREEISSLLGRVHKVRQKYCQSCYQLTPVAELNQKQLCQNCEQRQDSTEVNLRPQLELLLIPEAQIPHRHKLRFDYIFEPEEVRLSLIPYVIYVLVYKCDCGNRASQTCRINRDGSMQLSEKIDNTASHLAPLLLQAKGP